MLWLQETSTAAVKAAEAAAQAGRQDAELLRQQLQAAEEAAALQADVMAGLEAQVHIAAVCQSSPAHLAVCWTRQQDPDVEYQHEAVHELAAGVVQAAEAQAAEAEAEQLAAWLQEQQAGLTFSADEAAASAASQAAQLLQQGDEIASLHAQLVRLQIR